MVDVHQAVLGGNLRVLLETGTVTGLDRRATAGAIREPARTRRPSRRWSSGTGRWSCASAGRSSATITTPRTPSRPRSWSWSGRPARSAGATSLASWLHGVACRVAPCARPPRPGGGATSGLGRDDGRRGPRPRTDRDATPGRSCTRSSAGCPSGSAPVVLCYLEGRTYEEAAQGSGVRWGRSRAGWPRPASGSGAGWSGSSWPRWRDRSDGIRGIGRPRSRSRLDWWTRQFMRSMQAVAGGAVPVSVSRLAKGVLQTMFLTPTEHGRGGLDRRREPWQPGRVIGVAGKRSDPRPRMQSRKRASEVKTRSRSSGSRRRPHVLTGRVVDEQGRPIPGAEVRMKLFRREFSAA